MVEILKSNGRTTLSTHGGGCTKISDACDNCYEKLSQKDGVKIYGVTKYHV